MQLVNGISGIRPKSADGKDHITILMATYNGAPTLDAQLESFERQSHRNWSLIVSDDGSSDQTIERVTGFAQRNPARRILILRGPGKGAALNFLSLLRAAGGSPWVAFSDQDDVWMEERLERGLAALRDIYGPAIYGSRTTITDANLNPLRLSPLFQRSPGFANALVQNIAGGNTMLLNRAALDVLQPASRRVKRLASHDWWAYQLITGVGGRMIYDPHPTVLYRQHGNNLIGANDTLRARFNRLVGLFNGRFSEWCRLHTNALEAVERRLTPDARRQLRAMIRTRDRHLPERIRAFRQSGLYRQTWCGSLALWLAVCLGRF